MSLEPGLRYPACEGAIVFAAGMHKAGLVSICTHGTSGQSHALARSIAEAVLRQFDTPTLLTRAMEAPPQQAIVYPTVGSLCRSMAGPAPCRMVAEQVTTADSHPSVDRSLEPSPHAIALNHPCRSGGHQQRHE